jgi:hypothetical protein
MVFLFLISGNELSNEKNNSDVTILFIKNLKKYESIIYMKPLLDGKQISSILNITPGKKIGEIISCMIDWQITNFDKNLSKIDATSWLKENF